MRKGSRIDRTKRKRKGSRIYRAKRKGSLIYKPGRKSFSRAGAPTMGASARARMMAVNADPGDI